MDDMTALKSEALSSASPPGGRLQCRSQTQPPPFYLMGHEPRQTFFFPKDEFCKFGFMMHTGFQRTGYQLVALPHTAGRVVLQDVMYTLVNTEETVN